MKNKTKFTKLTVLAISLISVFLAFFVVGYLHNLYKTSIEEKFCNTRNMTEQYDRGFTACAGERALEGSVPIGKQIVHSNFTYENLQIKGIFLISPFERSDGAVCFTTEMNSGGAIVTGIVTECGVMR